MRLVLGSALVLLSACPPPPTDACVPRPGFGFPSSVTSSGTETVVSVGGSATLTGPPVTCIPDPGLVTVLATLSGGGQPTQRVPASIELSTEEESRVKVDLKGLQPGEYSLQVFVEPTIAAINAEVIVAIDRTKPPAPRLWPSCTGSHGRTSLGTSICVDQVGSFEARLEDGGAVSFSGTSVRLANDVLWVERPGDGGTLLERHVERSAGQFERTHVLAIGGARIDAADEQHVWAGRTFATTWADGGTSTLRTANNDLARLRLIEDGRGLEFRVTDEVCEFDGGCWSIAAIGGREIASVTSRHVWFEQESGVLRGLARPLSAQRASAITSHSFPVLRVHGFSDSAFRLRGPSSLVLAPPGDGSLLIERADGVFEAWEPQRGWILRDATDFFVAFDVGAGQTAVFLR